MVRIISILAIFSAVMIIIISTVTQIFKGKTVVLVGVDAYSSPFSITDEKGTLIGFDIDVMNAIAKASGFNVEYRIIPFKALTEHLQKGRVDAVIAPIDTTLESNTKYSDESDPYYINFISFAVKNEKADMFSSINDFRGHKICIVENSRLSTFVRRNLSESTILMYENTKQTFHGLYRNDCVAVFDYRSANEYFIYKHDFKGLQVKPLDIKNGSQIYRISVQKGNIDLASSLTKAIRFLRQNGELDKIYNKWFNRNSELSKEYRPLD